ncbi:MAG: hypothetical protein PVI40_01200 [Chlamydiota bacterium]|jgi:hypothetical protein
MTSINFNPSNFESFGATGLNTARKMLEAVTSHGLEATYDAENKKFTILDSSKLSNEFLEKIFSEKAYESWKPKALDEVDALGNRLVKIVCISPAEEEALERASLPQAFSLSAPAFKEEEIKEVQEALSKSVIDTLIGIMSNDKTELTGIWYPTSLNIFLQKAGKTMPPDYWMGYANTEYFSKTGDFTFELKEGKLPSDAIEALLNGPSVLDCGNATQLAYYKAILDIVGPNKFNELFSGKYFTLKITQHGITDSNSHIACLADYTEAAKARVVGTLGHRPITIGEECHFEGVKFYANKHPVGAGGGWNVIYVGNDQNGEQLFASHGLEKPITEREINRLLVEAYNQERTEGDERFIKQANDPTLYDRDVNSFLKTQYTIPLETADSAVGGFLSNSCRRLLPKSILALKAQSIDPELILGIIENRF